MSALPTSMNFSERIRAKGVGAAKETLTIAPNNGPTYNLGTGMMQFEIPGGQLGKYADFSSLYVACDITNGDASANIFNHIGSMALVNRLVVTTNTNKQFCDISYKNMLDAIMVAKQGDSAWLNTNANIMFGCGSSAIEGYTFGIGATARFLIPLSLIGIDSMMFPLSSQENLRFQIYLEQAYNVFNDQSVGITNANITISNAYLHYDTVQLTMEEDRALIKDFDGMLVITAPCWAQLDTTIPLLSTATSINLGFSKKRAKRLLIAQRNTTSFNTMANANKCHYCMDQGGATEFSLKLNGKEVKTQAYSLTNGGPEFFAESIKSNGGRILDIHPSNSTRATYIVVETAAGATDGESGRFFVEFDLQNGLENVEGTIINGINVINGNFTLAIKRSATTNDRYVNIYLEYWSDFVLNAATGVWDIYS